MDLASDEVTFAAIAWHAAARREWWKRNPKADDCPIPPWDQLDQGTHNAFRRCVLAALIAVQPDNVVKMRERLAERDDQGQR